MHEASVSLALPFSHSTVLPLSLQPLFTRRSLCLSWMVSQSQGTQPELWTVCQLQLYFVEHISTSLVWDWIRGLPFVKTGTLVCSGRQNCSGSGQSFLGQLSCVWNVGLFVCFLLPVRKLFKMTGCEGVLKFFYVLLHFAHMAGK